jgi:ISXO2-like transposase domain
MAERKGRVVVTAVPNAKRTTIMPHVQKKVLPETTVYANEYRVYDNLDKKGYRDSRVHPVEETYVAGDVPANTIEGFWSLLKRGIAGVYHSVSVKHF